MVRPITGLTSAAHLRQAISNAAASAPAPYEAERDRAPARAGPVEARRSPSEPDEPVDVDQLWKDLHKHELEGDWQAWMLALAPAQIFALGVMLARYQAALNEAIKVNEKVLASISSFLGSSGAGLDLSLGSGGHDQQEQRDARPRHDDARDDGGDDSSDR